MTTLIKIGNSQGVRIPRHLIDRTRLEGKRLVFEVMKSGLLVKPEERKPRAGWEDRFLQAKGKPDAGLIEDALNHDADIPDWQW